MYDLISRKAAIDAIKDILLEPDSTQYIWSSDALNAVRNAPTVDAVPVVHGRWKEINVFAKMDAIEQWQSSRCSNCGLYHTTPFMYYFKDYNYCPNCGAKMDGGMENGE